jgi:hypothetical protein
LNEIHSGRGVLLLSGWTQWKLPCMKSWGFLRTRQEEDTTIYGRRGMHAQGEREALHIGVVSVAMMVTTERKKKIQKQVIAASLRRRPMRRSPVDRSMRQLAENKKSSSQKGTTETSRCKKEFRPLASCFLFVYWSVCDDRWILRRSLLDRSMERDK